MNGTDLSEFVQRHFVSGSGPFVPARVQAALALLERLKDEPSLILAPHLSRAGQSIKSHETYGQAVHERLEITPINKNHGRRSSAIHDWGQPLLDMVASSGFSDVDRAKQLQILNDLQHQLAEMLRDFHDSEPIIVRCKGKSAESIIGEVLSQADAKSRASAVAQYLVGAKLQMRFPSLRERIIAHGSNKGDRSGWGDPNARRGDFDLGEYVFEVCIGPPDPKHLNQVIDVLEDRDCEMWLLVRRDRLEYWMAEVARLDTDQSRVVIASVELFVGQNVAELGGLRVAGQRDQLKRLFDLYNDEWMPAVGSPGLHVELRQ